MLNFERPGDELRDDEFPDEPWGADEVDDSPTIACPSCGADVFEDAEQCPSCGHWLTDAERQATPRYSRAVIVVFYLAGVLAALGLVLALFGIL